MADQPIPTLYEWAGNNPTIFENLIEYFYNKAVDDPILQSLFQGMPREHRHNVALWFIEVMGGPNMYSKELGGHARMAMRHAGRHITEEQRFRWTELMKAAADQVGLPDDPEFRSAFMGYIEWGTRMAMIGSQPGHNPSVDAPMPIWGWGERPPYQPNQK